MVVKKKVKHSIYALPRKKKFPLRNKQQAISAVAYSKKGVKNGTLTVKERNIVLRKVHQKFPSIHITPVRKTKGKWDEATEKAITRGRRKKREQELRDAYPYMKAREYEEYGREAEERKRDEIERERERKQVIREEHGRQYREAHGLD